MRRILFMFFAFFIGWQGVAGAEVNKDVSQSLFSLSSRYALKTPEGHALRIFFVRSRVSSISVVNNGEYRLNVYAKNADNASIPRVWFDFDIPPRVELKRDGLVTALFLPKKSSRISAEMMVQVFDKEALQMMADFDGITIVVPYSDYSERRFELPPDIVAEWRYILSVNIMAERDAFRKKEFM